MREFLSRTPARYLESGRPGPIRHSRPCLTISMNYEPRPIAQISYTVVPLAISVWEISQGTFAHELDPVGQLSTRLGTGLINTFVELQY
jgi:hypothetical protein